MITIFRIKLTIPDKKSFFCKRLFIGIYLVWNMSIKVLMRKGVNKKNFFHYYKPVYYDDKHL